MSKARKQQAAIAAKKAKSKKMLIWSAIAIIALAIILIFALPGEAGSEIYSDGYQKIELLKDGTFTASLYHGVSYAGSFSKSQKNGYVTFTVEDEAFEAPVDNNVLTLPDEWQDSHGHGSTLNKQ